MTNGAARGTEATRRFVFATNVGQAKAKRATGQTVESENRAILEED